MVDANPRAEEIFGCPREELLTAGPERYFVPSQPDGIPVSASFANHIEWVLAGNPLLVERHILNSAGQALVCEVRLANLPSTGHRQIRASFIDITERKAAEARIEFLANHDVLTGLPNRLLLADRLDKAIAQADRAGTKLALLFLDLDNFKSINDSLGHSIGDALLQAVAARLSHCVRETDSIGRQGGDEFLMFLTGLSVADATAAILQKIIDTLQTTFDIEGNEITTSVSIGVAIYPEDGRDFDTLRKKADTAMYRAKDAGRNTYAFFDEQMNVEAVEHQRLRGDLRRALDRDEFVLHYQPQIDLTSGAIVGAEALIRWSHPQLGLLPPGRFIALAEDCGLIVPIGESERVNDFGTDGRASLGTLGLSSTAMFAGPMAMRRPSFPAD